MTMPTTPAEVPEEHVRYAAHGAVAWLWTTADGAVALATTGTGRLTEAERHAFEEGIANQRTILVENVRRARALEAAEGTG